MKPTYTLLEIRDLLNACKGDNLGIVHLTDIIIEDDELYSEVEIDLITDMIQDEINNY
jgi:hypothetical protein